MGRNKQVEQKLSSKRTLDNKLSKQLHMFFEKVGLTPNGTRRDLGYGIAQWAHDRKVHRFFLITQKGTIYLYKGKSWKKVIYEAAEISDAIKEADENEGWG